MDDAIERGPDTKDEQHEALGLWDREGILEQLQALWVDECLSGSKIAARLTETYGIEITRSAVLGKLGRIGLLGEARTAARSAPEPATTEEPRHEPNKHAQAGRLQQPSAAQPSIGRDDRAQVMTFGAHDQEKLMTTHVQDLPFQPTTPGPKVGVISASAHPGFLIQELRECQCRYAITPIYAAIHRFCGAKAVIGRSWCKEHNEMVFVQRAPGLRSSIPMRAKQRRA